MTTSDIEDRIDRLNKRLDTALARKDDLGNPLHLAAVQKDFAVHAWLGNWDVLGQALDNTRIDENGNAICIDPGGVILFRAQGEPKDAGAFDKNASDFETMRTKDQYQQKVYGGMSKSMLADSAQKLAGVTDDAIKQAFSALTEGRKLTGAQNEFLDLAINHLTERGLIDPALFYESPYTDLNDQGISGVFPTADVQTIIGVVKDIRMKAVA